MNAPRGEPEAGEGGSELRTLGRLRLYIRRPSDAFIITSRAERRRDAFLIFFLYFLVKVPVAVQRSTALGNLDKLNATQVAAAVAVALVLGGVLTLVLNVVGGVLLHLVTNVLLGAGRGAAEALRLPFLCMAPQLVLVLEFPSLVLDFRGYGTFLALLVLRLAAGVLTFRVLYAGLRVLFGLSRQASVLVTMAPLILVILLTIPMVRGALR